MTDELPEIPAGATILSPEMIAKRMVWDMVPCPMAVDVSRQLGLSPASDDVEEMEHQASHQRLRAAATLFPVIQSLTQDAVKAAMYAMLMASDDKTGLDDDGNVIEDAALERAMSVYPLVLQTTYAVLAELQDVGLMVSPMVLGRKFGASVAVSSEDSAMDTLLDLVEEMKRDLGMTDDEGEDDSEKP